MRIKGLFNDNESDIDYIGYKNYINVFKYIIDNEQDLIEPPIVFGLHGDWGIGKSTFMNLLGKDLEKNKDNIVIRINPWEYREFQDIVSLFFIELYKELRKKSIIEKFKDGCDKLFELIYPLTVKFNSGVADFEYEISKIKDIEKANIIDKYINENHLRKENIDKLFNKTFLSNYKVIVFIDDLDRCSVDKVMNILESIKLFLNTNRCIFFLGCDVNYLNSAVGNYYENFIKINNNILFDEKIENNQLDIYEERSTLSKFTKEYLEKIIQVPFHIPSIDKNSMEIYIDSILNGKYGKSDDNNNLLNLLKKKGSNFKNDIPKKLVKELFAKRIINPRRIKRVLNIIYLNYLFLLTKVKDITKDDINLLVLLAVINDENQTFYKDKLSSKEICIDTFNKIFMIIKKPEETEEMESPKETEGLEVNGERRIEKENVIEGFFEVFFNYTSITSKEEIIKCLSNITNILTVSNTTHIVTESNYTWGRLGEIESVSKTKRKIKNFLNNIDDSIALDFSIWYLKTIFLTQYDNGKLQAGIYNNSNLLIFKSKDGKVENFSKNYLIKFSYDSQNKYIKIILDTAKYASNLDREVFAEKEIIVSPSNIDSIKIKLIKVFGEED